MAKLSSIQKNLFRSKLIQKYKSKRDNLKSKIKDKTISIEERIKFQNKLNDLPRNGSSIRHRNRCEITGRPRGNYRKFGCMVCCFSNWKNSRKSYGAGRER